jgi:uncharacterized damage-inducible protein DinB
MRTPAVFAASICALSIAAFGQSGDNPLSAGNKNFYNNVKNNIVRSAEKVPEEDYSFKPTPEVRSFGQVLGHIADANYMFCSAVLGEKNPAPGVEKSKAKKAELVEALNQSFSYCDKAYDGMTDQSAAEMVKFFGREMPKLTVLSINTAHDNEHYGNLVTYMRLKSIVPPSSEQRR